MNQLDQMNTPLFDAIKTYHSRTITPFDVPGHKHGNGLKEFVDFVGSTILEIDVNAMEALDNICNPISVIKEAEDLAAKAYGAKNAFFLVNGTTSGVQAMIMTVCRPGDKVILPRNAHKSATAALILSGAIPVYIQPELDEHLGIAMGVTPESVEQAIRQNPDAKAVFLVHPTYYGIISDIDKIVELAHKHNMFSIADEAHGAHFAFHDQLPFCAVTKGADITTISMHKTGGSLTQSSLLALNSDKISANKVKSILNLTQTTSASYLLMTSLDIARKQLATRGKEILTNILALSRYARDEINKIDGYYVFGKELIGNPGVFDIDETKLGIHVKNIGLTGYEIEKILNREYSIQVEMADLYNILAIISLGDNQNSINTLIDALKHIKEKYATKQSKHITKKLLKNPEVIISPRDAYYSRKHSVKLRDAIGEISGESVMAYPPGIPIVAPGEKITEEMVEYIELLKSQHCLLQGTEDAFVQSIRILGY